MQYVLLIYSDEERWLGLSDEDRNALRQEYVAYTQSLRDRGSFVEGAGLQGTATATTVRVRDGEQLVTDGPFAETKEQLGGFYLIEADSIDGAIAAAGMIPSARFGSIEVRPVLEMPAEVPA